MITYCRHLWFLLIFGLSKERPILGDHLKAHIHEIWRISCSRFHADFMKSSRFCADFMKSGEFQVKSSGFHADFRWNLEDFRISGRFHLKSTRFHVDFMKSGRFQVKSAQNLADFMWNPPTKLINQIFQEKLLSFMECCGKAMSWFHMKSARFHEIHRISWNLPDFERPIARNGKPYVIFSCQLPNELRSPWTYF